MNKTRKAKQAQPVYVKRHFTVPVALDVALEAIRNMADEQQTVTITELNNEQYDFKIEREHDEQTSIRLHGQLQRWQGTATRIECDTAIFKPLQATMLIISLVVCVFTIAAYVAGLEALVGVMMICGFVSLMALLSAVTESDVLMDEETYKAILTKRYQATDDMLNTFVDTFRQYGTLEFLDTKAKPIGQRTAERDYPQQSRRGTDATTPHHRIDDLSDDEKSRQARNRSG
ncbi:MAG: hypothetical protein ACPG7F_06515 [Aggregatilineales bacterium]